MAVDMANSINPIETITPPKYGIPALKAFFVKTDESALPVHSPEIMITSAVIVQIIRVSINGPIIATSPSRTGSFVFAAACAIGALPSPASLENAALLTPHVIAGSAVDAVTAYSLNGTMVETLSGKAVGIAIEDGSLRIQGAKVISSDIYTTNGIIHVIDRVITDPASE